MNVDGKHYRTIWLKEDDSRVVQIIDQQKLPHQFEILDLTTVDQVAFAIKDMIVRGAGSDRRDGRIWHVRRRAARPADQPRGLPGRAGTPTARRSRPPVPPRSTWNGPSSASWTPSRPGRASTRCSAIARRTAQAIADEDAEFCRRIGEHGVSLIEAISRRKNGATVNVLTHCNAGWLAFVDYGTATAPIYAAYRQGHQRPRLGGRNPPAQPGRQADRLGAGPAWRLARRGRGQRRRPPDAARHGGPRDHRQRPDHVHRRRRQQDRDLSQGPGRPRQRRAVLHGPALVHLRLGAARRRARASRSRSAIPTKSPTSKAATRTRSSRCC